MKEYRIVTNGIDFHLQWLGKTFLLKHPKWYDLKRETYAGNYTRSFSTRPEAQAELDEIVRWDIAIKRGYIPV